MYRFTILSYKILTIYNKANEQQFVLINNDIAQVHKTEVRKQQQNKSIQKIEKQIIVYMKKKRIRITIIDVEI